MSISGVEKINNNMRCFEIYVPFLASVYFLKINNNIRCFEIQWS